MFASGKNTLAYYSHEMLDAVALTEYFSTPPTLAGSCKIGSSCSLQGLYSEFSVRCQIHEYAKLHGPGDR